MSLTTVGYLQGPQGSPNAQPVQFDPTYPRATTRAHVVLLTTYWRVPASGISDAYANSETVIAGQGLSCPLGEALALVTIGAATWGHGVSPSVMQIAGANSN